MTTMTPVQRDFLEAATNQHQSELKQVFVRDDCLLSIDGFRLHAIRRVAGDKSAFTPGTTCDIVGIPEIVTPDKCEDEYEVKAANVNTDPPITADNIRGVLNLAKDGNRAVLKVHYLRELLQNLPYYVTEITIEIAGETCPVQVYADADYYAMIMPCVVAGNSDETDHWKPQP